MPTGGLPRDLALDPEDVSRFSAAWFFAEVEIASAEQLEAMARNVNGDPIARAVLYRRAMQMHGDPAAWLAFLGQTVNSRDSVNSSKIE